MTDDQFTMLLIVIVVLGLALIFRGVAALLIIGAATGLAALIAVVGAGIVMLAVSLCESIGNVYRWLARLFSDFWAWWRTTD